MELGGSSSRAGSAVGTVTGRVHSRRALQRRSMPPAGSSSANANGRPLQGDVGADRTGPVGRRSDGFGDIGRHSSLDVVMAVKGIRRAGSTEPPPRTRSTLTMRAAWPCSATGDGRSCDSPAKRRRKGLSLQEAWSSRQRRAVHGAPKRGCCGLTQWGSTCSRCDGKPPGVVVFFAYAWAEDDGSNPKVPRRRRTSTHPAGKSRDVSEIASASRQHPGLR